MIEKTTNYFKYVIYYFERTLMVSKFLKTSSNKPNSTQTPLHKIPKIPKIPKIS